MGRYGEISLVPPATWLRVLCGEREFVFQAQTVEKGERDSNDSQKSALGPRKANAMTASLFICTTCGVLGTPSSVAASAAAGSSRHIVELAGSGGRGRCMERVDLETVVL